MKILLIHQYFKDVGEPGGTRFNEMTRAWAENGHEVTVVCGMLQTHTNKKTEEYRGKWIVKKKQGLVQTVRCHVSEKYNVSFLGRLWAYFSFAFSSVIGGLFYAGRGYDVVVVSSPPLFVGVSAYIVSRLRNIPYLFEVRDLWPESAIDTGVLKNKFIIKLSYRVERFVYENARVINVLTPAFKNILIERKNIPASKISYIPNASDFSFSDSLLESFDRDGLRNSLGLSDKFVIIYVGAHGVANHLEQVLETAELVQDTRAHFLLIGDGMQKAKLKKMASDKALDNVTFIDPVTKVEVIKYILASDMGASVLKNVETFKTVYSNKTFDYFSCKKAIFMAIDGVSRDLVEEADAGVFVEPENPRDFAEKVRFYLQNPDLIRIQGESGYRFAKKNFDREKLAKKYLQVLQDNFSK